MKRGERCQGIAEPERAMPDLCKAIQEYAGLAALPVPELKTSATTAMGSGGGDLSTVILCFLHLNTVAFIVLCNFHEVDGELVFFCYFFRVFKNIVAFKHDTPFL
jgi:hypothetical protein